jgi:hypothetical protein
MTVAFEALFELDLAAVPLIALLGVIVAALDGVVPIVALVEVFVAGEKLIFVCRFRSRGFVRAIFVVGSVKVV